MTHETLPANTMDLYRGLAAELRAVALRPWDQVEHLLQEHLTDSELRRMLMTARIIPTASRADAHCGARRSGFLSTGCSVMAMCRS